MLARIWGKLKRLCMRPFFCLTVYGQGEGEQVGVWGRGQQPPKAVPATRKRGDLRGRGGGAGVSSSLLRKGSKKRVGRK